MSQALIIKSSSHNPWHNLALEEYLMHNMPDNDSVALYLWQNQNTVVIGRNQNAWAECKTALLEEEGGRLARRTTGGGAVFHDLGNLNFSIILPEKLFNLDNTFHLVLKAVQKTGIQAERSGRNDLLTNGLKFSGNAFRIDKGFGLHHGTLLVHSEYERVGRYLTVSPAKLAAKGVKSVRSRITNLKSIAPDITVKDLEESMIDSFHLYVEQLNENRENEYSYKYLTDHEFNVDQSFSTIEKTFSSWDWRYGETINFDIEIETRFDWGMIRLGFVISDGFIKKSRIYSDALESDLLKDIAILLEGCKFHSSDIIARLLKSDDFSQSFVTEKERIIQDISDWIKKQGW